MSHRLFPGWYSGAAVLPALRTLFTYSGDGRATGWLYLPDRPPVTPWPHAFISLGPMLLTRLKATTGTTFTACCFQAYLDGSGCGWHHDRGWGAQAILSLGVSRTFGLRRGGAEQWLRLVHGDLLYMPPGFQDEWEHCVPTEEVPGERCSLVFRSPHPKEQIGGSQRSLCVVLRLAVDLRDDR